jgi:phosphoenolpyruvate synthase/pyruvate phosphate dikinase
MSLTRDNPMLGWRGGGLADTSSPQYRGRISGLSSRAIRKVRDEMGFKETSG